MKLSNLLGPEKIILEMKSTGHTESIEELVDHLVDGQLLAKGLRDECLAALIKREEKVSTGIGSGVAIPHALSEHLDEAVAILGRSTRGVDFEALDNAPVHFVVLFLIPQKQYHLHLRTLAAISKIFGNSSVRRELASATTRKEVLSIIAARPEG